ncbi:MAG: hypothetical protein ACI9BO_001683 [Zhongshania sp.]|jgi:hypothetical protein
MLRSSFALLSILSISSVSYPTNGQQPTDTNSGNIPSKGLPSPQNFTPTLVNDIKPKAIPLQQQKASVQSIEQTREIKPETPTKENDKIGERIHKASVLQTPATSLAPHPQEEKSLSAGGIAYSKSDLIDGKPQLIQSTPLSPNWIEWLTVFIAALAAIAGFGAWNAQNTWWTRRYSGLSTNLAGWNGTQPPPNGDLKITPHAYEGKIIRLHRISLTIFGATGGPVPKGEEVQFIITGGLSKGVRLYNYTAAIELNTFQDGRGYQVRNTMPTTPGFPTYQAQGIGFSGQIFGEERLPIEIRVRNLGASELFVSCDIEYHERVTPFMRVVLSPSKNLLQKIRYRFQNYFKKRP